MIKLSKLKVSTKILIPVIIIAVLGNLISNYISTTQMRNLSNENTKQSLEMLTSSIFLTLRNAMNTGDPATIKDAEERSRKEIKGLDNLFVAKSKETIEMYSPDTKFTTDKNILKVFNTKKELGLDIYKNGSHFYRVLKPMIATQDCLLCHANQKLGDVVGVIDLSFSLDSSDELISEASNFLLVVSIIIIGVILVAILWIVNRVTNPLKTLKEDLEMFFQFLSKERDTIEPFAVESMDEIGQMINSINENVEKSISQIKQDSDAIKRSSEVCALASRGNFSVQIEAQTKNNEIRDLIEIVNGLIDSMNERVNRVLNVLDDYSQDHYSARIESKGETTGDIKKLFDQVNVLGETLVKLSSQNLKNGLALEQTSGVLSKNVENLSSVLNKESNSLEAISNDLDVVTNKINETSKNSKEMSSYAEKLSKSATGGKELASNTASAMQIIDEQVTSINEAITVIDQIAFQTNILSLNAAVEAATAGEAGKGFAVVAQEVRNLAARSAEAATQIKSLVENAKIKADDGKDIADNMISGYTQLNENIESTTKLIELVAQSSKEQEEMINSVNRDIQEINIETKHNVSIAKETNIVAHQASDIAHIIVEDASEKNFSGKNDIKIRKKITNVEYKGPERRKIEGRIKKGDDLNRK